MENNDDQIQLDLNQDQAGQVVQNVPAEAQTTLAFRVEQSKIPDFWGQKAKDTVTAIVFIRKIDDLARSNNWNDTTTYANVANAFKGFARDWLFATADMLDWTEAQLTWTNLKQRFQKQFATQTDDRQIIDGLSNLAMGPNETTGELLARITNTMVIIKESYTAYDNKVLEPPTDAHGLGQVGLLEPTATQWKNDTVNNMLHFFKMQLFRASLPGDLRKAVAQHDQTTIMLDDMYQVATDTQRESGAKTSKTVSAIQDNSQSEVEDDEKVEDEVTAFQSRRNNRFQNRNRNQYQGSGQRSKYNSGNGNNRNRNGKHCFYCKIQNHTQEECQKRIKDNKPCKDKQGRAYWPKVYVTNENQESDQQGQQPVFH
jgi:hypothetical protein